MTIVTQASPPEGVIETPDGALHYVEQDLYDAGNPDGVLAASVHQRDGITYCNLWYRQRGQWGRILPERVLEDLEPSALMLTGECVRLIATPDVVARFQGDMRLNLCFRSLNAKAERAAAQADS